MVSMRGRRKNDENMFECMCIHRVIIRDEFDDFKS